MAIWTREERLFVEENWGKKSIPAMAEELGRSVEAIKIQACHLKLGPHLDGSPDHRTFHQLCIALGHYFRHVGARNSWVGRYDFPMERLRTNKSCWDVVKLSRFWAWAEKHKKLMNFGEFKEGALGPEPGWVAEKRRADIEFDQTIGKKIPWSKDHDARLKSMIQSGCGYKEIADKLHRSESAVKRRIYDLKLKLWPVRQPRNEHKWTPSEVMTVKVLNHFGYNFNLIASYVGYSGLATNGLIERLTEVNDLEITDDELHDYKSWLPETLWPRVERYLKAQDNTWSKHLDSGSGAVPVVEKGAALL